MRVEHRRLQAVVVEAVQVAVAGGAVAEEELPPGGGDAVVAAAVGRERVEGDHVSRRRLGQESSLGQNRVGHVRRASLLRQQPVVKAGEQLDRPVLHRGPVDGDQHRHQGRRRHRQPVPVGVVLVGQVAPSAGRLVDELVLEQGRLLPQQLPRQRCQPDRHQAKRLRQVDDGVEPVRRPVRVEDVGAEVVGMHHPRRLQPVALPRPGRHLVRPEQAPDQHEPVRPVAGGQAQRGRDHSYWRTTVAIRRWT